jgi:DNA polymerase lambda
VLHKEGILTEDLAIPEDFTGLECVYRGLCQLPQERSRRRRIDFLTVPWESRGAALLYYTVRIHFFWVLGVTLSQNLQPAGR